MATLKLNGTFIVECFDKHGNLKWVERSKNTVVNEGINHALDILFISGTSQIDPWYVGLTDGSPSTAASDTLASASWSEFTNYSEGTRQEFVNVRSSQQVNNNASKATFTINADTQTVGGAFLASGNTKGATGDTLLCVSAFNGGNKNVSTSDTLNVEYQFNGASA